MTKATGKQDPKDPFDRVLDSVEASVENNIIRFTQDQETAERTVISDKPASDESHDKENPAFRIILWSIAAVMLLVLIVMMMIYG
ncbi:MAG: hypothetical protein OYH77_02720 [Pseudomonadota bacterium]|nr:hypothetical protein [Pseudomonadota bacterium]